MSNYEAHITLSTEIDEYNHQTFLEGWKNQIFINHWVSGEYYDNIYTRKFDTISDIKLEVSKIKRHLGEHIERIKIETELSPGVSEGVDTYAETHFLFDTPWEELDLSKFPGSPLISRDIANPYQTYITYKQEIVDFPVEDYIKVIHEHVIYDSDPFRDITWEQ